MIETKGIIPNDFKNRGSLTGFLCKYLFQRKKIWNQCKFNLGQNELIFQNKHYLKRELSYYVLSSSLTCCSFPTLVQLQKVIIFHMYISLNIRIIALSIINTALNFYIMMQTALGCQAVTTTASFHSFFLCADIKEIC